MLQNVCAAGVSFGARLVLYAAGIDHAFFNDVVRPATCASHDHF